MPEKPRILSRRWLAHSRLFHIEEVRLQFSNGEERSFERLNPWLHRTVMVVPMLDDKTVLLVKEYGAGQEDYYLSLPKGAVQEGEPILDGANRELMEEAGYGARQLQILTRLTLSPAYMGNSVHLVLAQQLYPKKLPGDEPEPLEVVPWKLDSISELLERPDFGEAYSLAALYLVREKLGGCS